MIGRRFFKTKLCKLFQSGRCPRASCSFAHGAQELRRSPVLGGRRDYRNGDLRDKLDRRYSPRRRYSPERDARGYHSFHDQKPASRDRGHSLSRSPARRSEGRHRKRHNLDGQSDASEGGKSPSVADDHKSEDRALSYDKADAEEEIKQLNWDIKRLEDDKLKLEHILDEKNDEANKLSSRVMDLEAQLNKEQEDCKRVTSKIKKFVKVHGRYLKAQEELKRVQSRFQRLGSLLGSETSKLSVNEESSANIASDEDLDVDYHVPPRHEEFRNNSSKHRKRSQLHSISNEDARPGTLSKKARNSDFATKPDKLVLEGHIRMDNSNKELDLNADLFTWKSDHKSNTDESRNKQGKSNHSFASFDMGKGSEVGNPSLTSMPHRALDELFEGTDIDGKTDGIEGNSVLESRPIDNTSKLPYTPVLSSSAQNSCKKYDGADEDVDVEKVDSDGCG